MSGGLNAQLPGDLITDACRSKQLLGRGTDPRTRSAAGTKPLEQFIPHMPDTGKINRSLFDRVIRPQLGATRPDVIVGPTSGIDFGVVERGEQAFVVATDPVSVLPELGLSRAGRFGTRIVLADAAVSGLAPTHLTISLALPPALGDDAFARLWQGVHETCRELGVAVTTGHTARYDEAQFPWVGAATAVAVGDPAAVVRPDGASPGEKLLVTKGPAVETTGLLTTLFPDQLPLSAETLATAQQRLGETGVVRDAVAAAEAGASAVHDATEGGLLGALHEMAAGADVGIAVDTDQVPVRPGVSAVCETLEMDPWTATSAGTLAITAPADDADAVAAALAARNTPVSVVGSVTDDAGVRLDDTPRSVPDQDASWPVYDRLTKTE